MSNHVHTKPEHAPAEVQEGRAWSYSCTSCGEAVMVGMREGKGTQALSTSTSSGSEADTKPSGTLEENRLAIFKIVSTHENPKCFMNRMCDGCNSKVQALLSLYQKELEKELSELNSAYYALAGANRNRAFAELLSERIHKLQVAQYPPVKPKLTGEQP